jgi:hypothetical protein
MGCLSPFSEINHSLKKLDLKISKFVKVKRVQTPPALQTFLCVSIGQKLPHWCMSERPKRRAHIQKSKVMEMVQSKFYCLSVSIVP